MREGEDQMNQQRPRKANKYNAPVGGSFEATLSPAPVREVRCLSPEGRSAQNYRLPRTVCSARSPVKHRVSAVDSASVSSPVAAPIIPVGIERTVTATAKGKTAAEAIRDPGTC